TGTATTRPTTPMSVPMVSTLAMVRTGGRAKRRSMIRGTTTFASTTCTITPSRITASTLTQLPVLTTNNAGSRVETSVPKNGTTATSPVKIPNASQYGTPSTHRPMAVSSASTSMASSWPTTQARIVAPASSRTRAPTGRCRGGSSDRMPSRYSRGCTARESDMTTTLAPSMNSLPPAAPYGRLDPRRQLVAALVNEPTPPDA